MEVVYKSHVGSQEKDKFQPVKCIAQKAVEDLVMYLSLLIILLPWTSVCGNMEVQGHTALKMNQLHFFAVI